MTAAVAVIKAPRVWKAAPLPGFIDEIGSNCWLGGVDYGDVALAPSQGNVQPPSQHNKHFPPYKEEKFVQIWSQKIFYFKFDDVDYPLGSF